MARKRPPATQPEDSIPAHIQDPDGILKKYFPKTALGREAAFVDRNAEDAKRSPGERASDGIQGDLESEFYATLKAKREAEIAAATTPEAMKASFARLMARMKAEGMLDENGDLKPASEMPQTGPERFINQDKGGKTRGGSKK